MRRSKVILAIVFLVITAKVQASPVSGLGNGWIFSSLDSNRAYLYTPHAMSWAEAEDFCQMVYGHLATDDSAEELRQYLSSANIAGAVWIGLHQSKPQTQFTWTNDFDWSEVSMAPGDGWGEYVEEYEAALCVSLDIDHGFRWDTRYCQGVLVAGTVCQIDVPVWVRDGRCRLTAEAEGENVTLRYYPDKELVQWSKQGGKITRLCSIEDKMEPELAMEECCDNYTVGQEVLENTKINKPNLMDQVGSFERLNITLLNNTISENETNPTKFEKENKSETEQPRIIDTRKEINGPKEKISVVVKFEVKNNTNSLLKKSINIQNETTLTINSSTTKTTKVNFETSIESSTVTGAFKPNSDTTVKPETTSSSLISFSTPKVSTTSAVLSTVHIIFPNNILNGTEQTYNETKLNVLNEKSIFPHFENVTNLNTITTVTAELSNSTAEISAKVSISTIFNSSQASTFTEVNTSWPANTKHAEGGTEGGQREDEGETITEGNLPLSRHKRSSGHRNSQAKHRIREMSRLNRNNRQQILARNEENSYNKKGA